MTSDGPPISRPCECKICTGELPDRPVSDVKGCPHCHEPITYAQTHKGGIYSERDSSGAILHLVHAGCSRRRLSPVHVFPRDAL